MVSFSLRAVPDVAYFTKLCNTKSLVANISEGRSEGRKGERKKERKKERKRKDEGRKNGGKLEEGRKK